MRAKAYSYIRMSTDVQGRRGESLRRQLELSEQYCQTHNLDLQDTAEYLDQGVSAFKGVNATDGALGRFLLAVNDGRIAKGSYLLIESLDRLSRQAPFEALQIFTSIVRAGIVLVTVAPPECRYDHASLRSADGFTPLLLGLVVMQRAHEESLQRSRRIAASWDAKRRRSDIKATKTAPAWLSLATDRRSFDLNEDRVRIVRQMFEDSASGIGATAITRRLNIAGIPPWGRAERGWAISTVKKILASRSVLGEYAPHHLVEGKRLPLPVISDYYPSIISEELFDNAQHARISRRHKGGRRGDAFANLFSGLAKCSYCGCSVRLIRKGAGGKLKRYLRCNAAVRAACTADSWRYSQFEASFLAVVREVPFGDLVNNEASKSRKNEYVSRRKVLESLISDNALKSTNLLTAMEQSPSAATTQSLVRRMDQLSAEAEGLKAELTKVESALNSETLLQDRAKYSHAEILRLTDKMTLLQGADLFELRASIAQLLRDYVLRIELDPNGPWFSDEEFAAMDSLKKDFVRQHYRIGKRPAGEPPQRSFIVFFKGDGNAFRFVQPDPVDPTKYVMQLSSLDSLQFGSSDAEPLHSGYRPDR